MLSWSVWAGAHLNPLYTFIRSGMPSRDKFSMTSRWLLATSQSRLFALQPNARWSRFDDNDNGAKLWIISGKQERLLLTVLIKMPIRPSVRCSSNSSNNRCLICRWQAYIWTISCKGYGNDRQTCCNNLLSSTLSLCPPWGLGWLAIWCPNSTTIPGWTPLCWTLNDLIPPQPRQRLRWRPLCWIHVVKPQRPIVRTRLYTHKKIFK